MAEMEINANCKKSGRHFQVLFLEKMDKSYVGFKNSLTLLIYIYIPHYIKRVLEKGVVQASNNFLRMHLSVVCTFFHETSLDFVQASLSLSHR